MQKQIDLMQNMIQQMYQLTQQSTTDGSSTNHRSNAKAKQPRNQFQSKYCWTHGLCHHHSKDCRTKADGHKDNATLDNRIGGSSKNIAE